MNKLQNNNNNKTIYKTAVAEFMVIVVQILIVHFHTHLQNVIMQFISLVVAH